MGSCHTRWLHMFIVSIQTGDFHVPITLSKHKYDTRSIAHIKVLEQTLRLHIFAGHEIREIFLIRNMLTRTIYIKTSLHTSSTIRYVRTAAACAHLPNKLVLVHFEWRTLGLEKYTGSYDIIGVRPSARTALLQICSLSQALPISVSRQLLRWRRSCLTIQTPSPSS